MPGRSSRRRSGIGLPHRSQLVAEVCLVGPSWRFKLLLSDLGFIAGPPLPIGELFSR